LVDLIIRVFGIVAFGVGGWQASILLGRYTALDGYMPWGLITTLMGMAVGGIIAPYITVRPVSRLFRSLSYIPSSTLLAGFVGLLLGLVLAALISIPFFRLGGWLGWGVPSMITLALGILGLSVGLQREREFQGLVATPLRPGLGYGSRGNGKIIVDTSAIIDGRIADLSQTGFIHGTLVVPRFVLDELRHIADSSDPMRRNRGRRGLEVLNRLRKESQVPLEVLDVDVPNGHEVDGKLVQLAKAVSAPILTTDYNLNRVAELQGVKVLNINELAHALKPVVLPGEELTLHIIQEGKEFGQGVGFLEDGTMVVVDGGRRYINSYIEVVVTRVLQTAAGRIIFAQPKAA